MSINNRYYRCCVVNDSLRRNTLITAGLFKKQNLRTRHCELQLGIVHTQPSALLTIIGMEREQDRGPWSWQVYLMGSKSDSEPRVCPRPPRAPLPLRWQLVVITGGSTNGLSLEINSIKLPQKGAAEMWIRRRSRWRTNSIKTLMSILISFRSIKRPVFQVRRKLSMLWYRALFISANMLQIL